MYYNQCMKYRSFINIPLTDIQPSVTNMIINDFDKMLSQYPDIMTGIENNSLYNVTFCKRLIDMVNANTFSTGTRFSSILYIITEAVLSNEQLRSDIRTIVLKYGLTLKLIEVNHIDLSFVFNDICLNKGTIGIFDSMIYKYPSIELFNNGMRTIGYYNQENELTTSEVTKFMIDGFNYYDDDGITLSPEE